MTIYELIGKMIYEGEQILVCLGSMHEVSGMAINVTYYDSEDVENAIRKINKWQFTTKDIIINGYGTNHRYLKEFEATITKKDSGFNYKMELEHEVNAGLAVLEGISDSFELGVDESNDEVKEAPKEEKPPLVFISHAEHDKHFANEIVTLLEFIGIKGREHLLCTSVDGYRIPLGEDIIEYLRKTFNRYNLFVIILHTHNYYTRPVCLNEMGAAWALKTKYFSVLAQDFDFGDMTGVVNNKDVAIKIGSDDCVARLNQLKNELLEFFGLPMPNEDRWPYYRDKFIENCLKLNTSKNKSKPVKVINERQQIMPLMTLSNKFRCFYSGDGCYPCQIDIKFAASEEDIFFKTITLSNKKRFVELVGCNVDNDIMRILTYLKPNTLDIKRTKKDNYTSKIEELYKTEAIYVEDHKLPSKALETMSFHGVIALRRQMDGYDDFPLEDWKLHVTYNVNGELVIPLKAVMI